MSYTPTNWENEVPSGPLRFQIVDDVAGEIAASAAINLVTAVTPGTPINSTNLNHIEQGIVDAHDGIVPIGGIILWSGSVASIPAGWHLCDGLVGTPDLRDRFIIGAGGAYNPNTSGGAATKDLSHTHTQGATGSGGSHSHTTASVQSGGPNAYGAVQSGSGAFAATDAHTHTLPEQTTSTQVAHTHTNPTTNTGGSAAQDILPPYYALAYIMRVS